MTESEWLTCTDPDRMLVFIQGKSSERKLRLFTIGCCRFVWEQITDEGWREAIHKAECYADGLLAKEEFDQLASPLFSQFHDRGYDGMRASEGGIPVELQAWAISICTVFKARQHLVTWRWATRLLGPHQTVLFRDIFGPLHFRPVTISPTVLAWNDGLVIRLAQTAYEERHLPSGTLDNGRLAVLADALEEAGCTDAEILGHLRGPEPHVRGCWPIDLCLGKS
jgi:hypothetical protein